MKIIVEEVCFLQAGTLCFGDIHIEDGFVERIDYKTPKPLASIAIPGFVDIHTHGFHGLSCESTSVEELHQLAIEYARRGTVGFVATFNTLPLDQCTKLFTLYREAFQGEYSGARFHGIHMEGPYLNPKEANDMDRSRLMKIDLQELEDFLWKNSDLLKIMSIAPELENGLEAVKMLHRFGVQVSLGHTRISYEDAMVAFENGVTQATHLCNAMEDLSHYRSGAVDAVILSDIMCEVNMDQVHVQRAMLEWLIKLLGTNRIMAISDGSMYSGFEYPDGFQINEDYVVKNNAIFYHDALSSSFRDLLDAFRFLYNELKYPLEDCIKMTSSNAGKIIQTLNYEIGLGKKADIVVMDHNLELKDVIVNGRRYL